MYLKTLSFIALLLSSIHVLSLESDANAEITIQSDRAEFNRKTGTAVYGGNVTLEQGTLLMNADQITLFSDTEQRLRKVLAEGKPARFQQKMEGDKGLTKAKGHTITYMTQDKTVTLLKESVLEQEGRLFSGNLIIYDIVNENVKAKGWVENKTEPEKNQHRGRIKMIIQPDKKPAEKNTNEDA